MQPQVRTLDQIMAELAPTYNPQIQTIRQRQSLIPQQIQAEEQGLQAKQGEAFENIVSGARRRGLGFSGIPLAEQARYTATDYLPALARLRQTGQEQALSLEEALLGIQERQGTMAQQIRQQELDRLQAFQEAEANRRAAAAAAFRPSLGGGAKPTAAPAQGIRESAYLEVQQRVASSGDRDLISDYNATAESARRGNQRDQIKLEVYRQARPDLFRTQPTPFGGQFNTPLVQSGFAPSGRQGAFGGGVRIPNMVGTF
jgi:hypothetical protein